MLFTIFCCFSTGLARRLHPQAGASARAIEIAVSLAVRDVEKEYEGRNDAMIAQLNAKEGELDQGAQPRQAARGRADDVARDARACRQTRDGKAGGRPARSARRPAKVPERRLKQDPLNVFEMSRPFTDTSYDALLATSDVVKIEPAGGLDLPSPRLAAADAEAPQGAGTAEQRWRRCPRRCLSAPHRAASRRARHGNPLHQFVVILPALVDPGVGTDQETAGVFRAAGRAIRGTAGLALTGQTRAVRSSPISFGYRRSSASHPRHRCTAYAGVRPDQARAAARGPSAGRWRRRPHARARPAFSFRRTASAFSRPARWRWRCRTGGTRRCPCMARPRCRAANSASTIS